MVETDDRDWENRALKNNCGAESNYGANLRNDFCYDDAHCGGGGDGGYGCAYDHYRHLIHFGVCFVVFLVYVWIYFSILI